MGFKAKTVDHGTRKEPVSRSPKTVAIRGGARKGPTIVSIVMELIVAVAVNLLRRHVKTWSAEINAKRKELAAPEKASSVETLRTRRSHRRGNQRRGQTGKFAPAAGRPQGGRLVSLKNDGDTMDH